MHARTIFEILVIGLSLLSLVGTTAPSAEQGYQKPPRAVTDILDVLPSPTVSVNPTRDQVALLQPASHPSIADLAEPMLRLAGHRINPQTNGPSRLPRIIGISLMSIAKGEAQPLTLPANARAGMPSWSPDG